MRNTGLRVGNYLYHKSGDMMIVTDIDRLGFNLRYNREDVISFHTVTINPIPLTEELLERLGCKDGYFGRNKCYRLVLGMGIIEFSKYCKNKKAIGLLISRIEEEVHIFQNIVKALTGKELTIK